MSRLVSLGRAAGGVGVTLGVAAAGAAVGFAAERYVVGRSLRGDDPHADEPFGQLRGTPVAVMTDDGVTLHVEVDEPPSGRSRRAPATVIFTHGYALNQDSWHFQRRDLRGSARLVFWDQRSHGRSSRAGAQDVTFERLTADLECVIEAVAPEGPLVLVGHSMGAMTVLSLAALRPELVGDRIAGLALIASSAAPVPVPTVGVSGPASWLASRLAPGVMRTLARQPDLIEHGRRAGGDLGYVITKRFSFVAGGTPSLVEFTASMNARVPIDVLAEFLPLFEHNDQRDALKVIAEIPTLIIGADGDRLTPVEHSRAIAQAVPDATYVEVAEAGHMVLLERHDVVTNSIDELISDVSEATGQKKRWWKRSRAGSPAPV